MKRIIQFLAVSLLLFFIPENLIAQKKMINLNDVIYLSWQPYINKYRKMEWKDDTTLTLIHDNNLVERSIFKDNEKILISLKEINTCLKRQNMDTINKLAGITWKNSSAFYLKINQQLYFIKLNGKEINDIYKYPLESRHIEICSQHGNVAGVKKNNVYVSLPGGRQIQVTKDTNNNIINGKTVSRREFGINKGLFWSPKGNYIAFYCKDITRVGKYPVYHGNDATNTRMIKYPMAGEDSELLALGIYDIQKDKTVYIKADDKNPYDYITNVTWGPGEQFIYAGMLNRGQDHLRLNKYRVSDGQKVKTLFEEKDQQYVEPQYPLYFFHHNAEKFIWMSRRDGYYHAYLYDTSGVLIKQLTKGKWEITKITGISKNDRLMVFSATKSNPMNHLLYAVNIQNGKTWKLSQHDGCHDGKLSPDGNYVLNYYATTDNPLCVDVIGQQGKMISTVYRGEEPLNRYTEVETEIGTLKAADGKTRLYYRMIKPPGMKSGKQYPVIVYVYGGPHNQLINNKWPSSFELWQYYLAQKGYVVFTMDNRGSAYRGKAFEQSIFRNLGATEMKDQMKGIEYLKKQDYVDPGRIGIYGWSYGGFLTMSLMLNYPGVYACGIAGAPVTNWQYYEVMYGERYMDTPNENPQGYEESNLTRQAGNLEDDMLIIHGSADSTVLLQNTLLFIKNAVNSKTANHINYFLYPGDDHHVGQGREKHLFIKMEQYFDEKLMNKD